MRVSLGCHVNNIAFPVPEVSHAPSQIEGSIHRIACQMPTPNRAKMRRFKRFVRSFLNMHFKDAIFSQTENFEFDDFINQTHYTQSRKENLTETHSIPFNLNGKGFNVKGFSKDEYYLTYKHFRGIMSRSDDYKTRVGPFFQKLDSIIFKNKHFIKKIPVTQRPAWLTEKFRFARDIFFTDFSSFEATFGPMLMKIELMIYEFFLQSNPNKDIIMKLLREGIGGMNKIKYRNFLFIIYCRRMSGEMNTSGANGIMNLLMTWFILSETGNRLDMESAFEGDDGAADVESVEKFPTTQDYKDLGANIKIEIPTAANEGSFCGLVYDTEDLDNVSDPLRTLISFGWTTGQYTGASDKKLLALLRSKALSLLYEYPACPITKHLALYGLRVTSSIDDDYLHKVMESNLDRNVYVRQRWTDVFDNYKHRVVIAKPITNRTRALVSNKFQIPVMAQISIENYLDSLNSLQPLDLPQISTLVHKDCFDYFKTYCVTVDNPENFVFINHAKRPYTIWWENSLLHPTAKVRRSVVEYRNY